MSEERTLLAESAAKVFRDLPQDFAAAWARVNNAAFPLLLVAEDKGGFGGGWEDANIVLSAAGASAVALPLAESMIATASIAAAGLPLPAGLPALARHCSGSIAADRFSGELGAVLFGTECDAVAACIDDGGALQLIVLSRADADAAQPVRDLSGMPRADLKFREAPVRKAPWPLAHDLMHLGALARTCGIAGALGTILSMTVEHAKTRQQFGRAIANFQAIQQQLAVLASETAAVAAAAAAACRAVDRGKGGFEIAAAKLRANKAVDIATGVAHQVHGAIGITQEHSLHRFTQMLWSWKSDFGNDRYWGSKLGARIAREGADAFWPGLTAQS